MNENAVHILPRTFKVKSAKAGGSIGFCELDMEKRKGTQLIISNILHIRTYKRMQTTKYVKHK